MEHLHQPSPRHAAGSGWEEEGAREWGRVMWLAVFGIWHGSCIHELIGLFTGVVQTIGENDADILKRREESDAVLHLPAFTLTSGRKEADCQKAPALSGKPQHIWMSSKDTTGWVPDTLEFAQPSQCFRQCVETQSLVLCCLCFCEGFCYFCLLSIQNIVIAFAKYFTVTYSDLLVCDFFF